MDVSSVSLAYSAPRALTDLPQDVLKLIIGRLGQEKLREIRAVSSKFKQLADVELSSRRLEHLSEAAEFLNSTFTFSDKRSLKIRDSANNELKIAYAVQGSLDTFCYLLRLPFHWVRDMSDYKQYKEKLSPEPSKELQRIVKAVKVIHY